MLPIQPNKSMFMRAEHTPPSAWMGHIPFAGWLTEAIQPTIFVELGTHYGTSYLAFCQAVVANGLATRCFAVDTWEGDAHAGIYGDEVYDQIHGYHARKYAGFSRLMRMTFDEAVEYFEDGSIDLLHIDGLHTYEAVRHDFETWLPKLSPRGVVIFHDTCVREREFGVWRFWAEVRERYPSFEFTHSHGLGVLAVGAQMPPSLLPWLGAEGAADGELMKDLFENLGRTIEADTELKRLNEALAHERALRREGNAAALIQVTDLIRDQVHAIRGDIVHAEHKVLEGQKALQECTDVQLEQAKAALAEHAHNSHAVCAELGAGVDAIRHDVVVVRDQVTQASDAGKQAISAVGEGLHNALSEYRQAVLTVQSELLALEKRNDASTQALGAELSARLDGIASLATRLESGLDSLQAHAQTPGWRRLLGLG